MLKRFTALLFCVGLFCFGVQATAFATSDYDNDVTLVSSVVLGAAGPNGGFPCTQPSRDVTLDWSEVLLNEVNHSVSYGEYDGYPAFVTQFQSNLNAGNGWFVQQITNGYNGTDGLEVKIGLFDPSSQLTFDSSSHNIVGFQSEMSITLFINHNWSDCRIVPETVNYANVQYDYSLHPKNLLFIASDNITYPTGYEGLVIPKTYTPPPATYVAMGDSFSSGEGNDPFETGTDESGVNECHRSTSAYPEWLSQTPSLSMDNHTSVACSGATTDNVLNGQWNEPAQVDALSDDTEVVTITIGGNDVGFSDFATACVLGDCDSSTTIYSDTMSSIDNNLSGKLVGVLDQISDNTDEAKVYFVGYPYITPGSGLSSLPTQCSYLNSSAGPGQDSVAARAVVAELNTVIGNTVENYVNTESDTTFTFVDPNNNVDGTFDGHDVCAGQDAYFHNVTPNDVIGNGYRAKLFHPNIDGQYEYYTIVMGEIEAS